MAQIHWFPGHMAKARRQIEEKLKLIDIVIELVDARIPSASKNPMLDDLLYNKKRIIIFTKIDLADKNQTAKWMDYYKEKGHHVLTLNLLNFSEFTRIVKMCQEELAAKIAKDASRGLKPRPIRALIVGIPNVGKSTLINKLSKRKAVKVGDKAGVTKAQQWIKVNQDFELLDTPGILWPKFDDEQVAMHLALTGAIKDEILPKDEMAIYALKFLNSYYQKALYDRFKVTFDNDEIETIVQAIEDIGRLRGCLMAKNEIDYDKVYDLILKDMKSGYLGGLTFDRI